MKTFKDKNHIIIQAKDAVKYPELLKLLDLNSKELKDWLLEDNDWDWVKTSKYLPVTMMFNDFRIEYRGNFQFGTFVVNDNVYVIFAIKPPKDVIAIVNWWLNDSENQIEIENKWESNNGKLGWKDVSEGIAYRGGSGYSYDLYAKTLIK